MSERLRDINPEKIQQLTTEHITRLVNKYGLTSEEAEDTVQEVMTNIIHKGSVDELEPYLFKALKNRALEFVGNKGPKDGKKKWRERNNLGLLDIDGHKQQTDWENQTILRIDIEEAADTLTPPQQSTLYNVDILGYTQTELALMENKNRVSIATCLARARKRMRKALGDDYLEE